MMSFPSRISWRITPVVGGVLFGWVCCVYPQAAAPPSAVAPKITQQASSTSSSGQFVVHGSELATRSAFCLLCDDTATALGRLLRDNARFSIPVVVVLKAPPDVDRTGPPISTNISQLAHGGFHLQINAQLRSDFQSDEFARELVRVLLAERILRNHAELKTQRDRVLPDWVLTGVTQALEFRSRSRPSAMFAAVFRGGQVFSVDKILTADPSQLDALSRTIYESSSCAIVLALLEQPDGPVRLGRFLNALALDNKSDRDLLKEHFPTLGVSKNSLEKWWSLQMATLATPSALETLSVSQTELKLDEALTLRYEPLPEKPAKGKTALVDPEGEFSPFDDIASFGSMTRLPGITEVWDAILGGQEVAAVPAKDADANADAGTDKKAKKKGAAKEEAKAAAKTPEKPKKDEPKPDKRAVPDKKEPEKKAPEKKASEKTAPEKKPEEKKEPEKKVVDKNAAKAPDKKEAEVHELRAKPHRIAQRPKGAPEPAPEDKPKEEEPKPKDKDKPAAPELAKTKESPAAKDAPEEKTTTGKRSIWNPANWFRKGGEKPAPEAAEKDTTSKRPKGSAKPGSKSEVGPDEKAAQGMIQDYLVIWKRPDRAKIFQRNYDLLNALKTQAHPLYRPLIADYLDAVRHLIDGKDRGIPDKLVALREQYLKISGQSKAVESYLDWYQASETTNYSGIFDDYLKLRDKLQKEIRPRGDAISQYLDSLEKEYEN